MVLADTSLLLLILSPSLMSDIPDQTRDNPVARILVWTAIMTAAATFWFVVAMMALAWLRHN